MRGGIASYRYKVIYLFRFSEISLAAFVALEIRELCLPSRSVTYVTYVITIPYSSIC